jgi:hypothetical protein
MTAIGVSSARSNGVGLRFVEGSRSRETDFFNELLTDGEAGIGESGDPAERMRGNLPLPFDRGPNMDNLRFGLPNAEVNCLMMGVFVDCIGVGTIGEAVTTDATAERGGGDRLTVTTAVLTVSI